MQPVLSSASDRIVPLAGPAFAVRYTLAVDVHYPLMMEPFVLLDEGAYYGSAVGTVAYSPDSHPFRMQVRAVSIQSVGTLTG